MSQARDVWSSTVYLNCRALVCGQMYGEGNAFQCDALSNDDKTVVIEGETYPLSWFSFDPPRLRGLAYKTREVTKWKRK